MHKTYLFGPCCLTICSFTVTLSQFIFCNMVGRLYSTHNACARFKNVVMRENKKMMKLNYETRTLAIFLEF